MTLSPVSSYPSYRGGARVQPARVPALWAKRCGTQVDWCTSTRYGPYPFHCTRQRLKWTVIVWTPPADPVDFTGVPLPAGPPLMRPPPMSSWPCPYGWPTQGGPYGYRLYPVNFSIDGRPPERRAGTETTSVAGGADTPVTRPKEVVTFAPSCDSRRASGHRRWQP